MLRRPEGEPELANSYFRLDQGTRTSGSANDALSPTAHALELMFRKLTGEDRRNPQGIRGCPYSPSARIGAQGTGPKLELCFGGRLPKMELEGGSKNGVQKCEEDEIKGSKSGARSSDILVLVFTMFLRPFSAKDVVKSTGKVENALRSKSKSAAVH